MSNENHGGAESVGNPGQTVDSQQELDQPRAVGDPGPTVHPGQEPDQPKAVGNPGPSE